jgi:hypothetical protein
VVEPPTITGFQFREEPVGSEADLADRLGEAVWVPGEWPVDLNPPEILLMLPPSVHSHDETYRLGSHYQLRSMTNGELLVVSGYRRRPGNLESGLRPLEGERFETLTRPADQRPHIVVLAPVWDVHVMGSVTTEMALSVARSLVPVTMTGH